MFLLALALATATPALQDLALHTGAGQGVFVEAEDGTVLVAEAHDRAVHPASVTKIPTTLALLDRLGPEHRFTTRLLGARTDGDTVPGDLLVEAEGDPFLVFENAFLVLRELRAMGIRRVRGGLRVRGPLFFNWKPDPTGRTLRGALEGRDGFAAWRAVASDGAPRPPGLAFTDAPATHDQDAHLLLVHRSAPLVRIVKALNCWSNNVFHPLSDRIGGPTAVERHAREAVPADARAHVVITNAAGAGTTNRLSPRAATALVRGLDAALARSGLSLPDVLPVARTDRGTLRDRLDARVVGKTGSYGSLGASSLAGALTTADHGRVYFAILNHGLPVPEARRRQDALVAALADRLGAVPWPPGPPLPSFADAQVVRGTDRPPNRTSP